MASLAASKAMPSGMRICSLLPSVTDICIALGLSDHIVAITHECDLEAIQNNRSSSNTNHIFIATKSGLHENLSQKQIDDAVKTSQTDISSLSLYPIVEDAFHASKPTIVLTQTLCQVCAPSPKEVKSVISACSMDPSIEIHAFSPNTLMEVVDTFIEVARVCRVPERGHAMKKDFMDKLNAIKDTCANVHNPLGRKPKVLLLEWIDPPYDGGHWIPDMIEWVGCEVALVGQVSIKSTEITWKGIYENDPDVILVACCGFDLKRNVKDALSAAEKFKPLRAGKENMIFACNGDLNFARPGPALMDGIAVVAKCVYGDSVGEVEGFGERPLQWERVYIQDQDNNLCDEIDIEDIHIDYSVLHQKACEAGEMSYADPETQYHVFTELVHKKRGRCCGSGCRHCPYDHQNVKDKANRIKQPAFLFEGNKNSHPLVCLEDARGKDVKVLFFSGGKDSFLAIRAIVKHLRDDHNGELCLVLLTTFDVGSRIIAHQEISIQEVLRQAEHLNIPLIGVPLHRGTSKSYIESISPALDLVAKRAHLSNKTQIKSIVFGDLHLEHIRGWRDKELAKFGVALEYPLWKVPYNELYEDLQRSNIEATVSAVTESYVEVGTIFDMELMQHVEEEGGDTFGENGEFHTFANVMKSTRKQALGL